MTALLIRRRRPAGEPPSIAEAPATASTLDGTAGAGRIVQALAELAIPLDAVIQAVVDAGAEAAELDRLDLGDRFDVVALGSHLVNLPDVERRRAFLSLAARHLATGGRLLVEHHPIDWAWTAEEVRATPGGSLVGMEEVRRDPPFVSAVSVYDIHGREERQPFTARVLSDTELAVELQAAGLELLRRLSPTWIDAHRGQEID